MDLIDQYKKLHEDPKRFWGASFNRHGDLLRPYIKKYGIESILDFGSGKGDQYKEQGLHRKYFHGIKPRLYDPAVEGINKLPKKSFDMVFSTDVLEHLEYEDLDATLNLIYSRATKFVYHGIANWETGRLLDDGRDMHIIQEDIHWWVDKIKPFSAVPTLIFVQTRRDKSIKESKVKLPGHGKVLIENGVETWLE